MNPHRSLSVHLVRIFTLALATASIALAGCGTLDEGEGADYPQGGQYPQVEPVQRSSLQAIPPAEPAAPAEAPSIAIGEDTTQYAETDPAALTEFRATLEPVGIWTDDATYGTVWTPDAAIVGPSFTPYVTAGHWTYDDDYVWVSDYDWGWAPFHYGRWVWIEGRGWSWIPGRRYAGAWVTWRVGPVGFGYVGWAPLPPSWYWRGGYAYGLYAVPPPRWSYCGSRDVFAPGVGRHVLPSESTYAIAAATRPYVPATPGVGAGGRIAAHPEIAGPPPSRLGFVGDVPRPPAGGAEPGGRGIAQARSMARPPLAAPQRPRVEQRMPNAVGRGPLPEIGPRATMPRYTTRPDATSPSFRSSPSYGTGATMRPSPSFRSSPSFGASSSPSWGSRSSPSFRSAPSFGASPSPSFRSSPSFGSGGGGGFRSSPSFGSGGGGGFRSAPSSGASVARPPTGGHSAPMGAPRGHR
jgi:hypothetical protein